MGVKREFFGETKDGAPVYLYHVSNNNGMEMVWTNFGAILRNVYVFDKDGAKRDVVLGYDSLDEYYVNEPFFGSTIGPSANRVNGAQYQIAGRTYHMSVNNSGKHNLHTDIDLGFHKRVWEAKETNNGVIFSLEQEDGEMGFPGNRLFTVEVSLSEDNEIRIHYHAESDQDTLINMTNHSYFNLGGHDSGKILDHVVQLNASYFTPVHNEEAIPTGEILPVEGTPMDFTQPKPIGRDAAEDYEQLRFGRGYDHNFCVDGAVDKEGRYESALRSFACVTNPVTGITMHAYTTLPGFQFYIGNFIETHKGKDGATYSIRDGFCLESQFYPNAINEENFVTPVFGPDKPYDSETVYKFG
ncbi:aldose epimerase family protein [Butyrivibrio sp. MC2013]|uniref:aldose epimerase family protein n=1 Tax=Butyrivibrio sp. MC2013 TaxID=1280686 RepID=UPI0003F6E169|nr:aldose epimerase family protein [Butyrivibrio sp. MC2013]